MRLNRREMIKIGAAGAVGLAFPLGQGAPSATASRLATGRMPVPFAQPFRRPQVLAPTRSAPGPDAAGAPLYDITQRAGTVSWLRDGSPTTVYGYNGSVPGPIISVDSSGDVADPSKQIVVRQRNGLPGINPLSQQAFSTSTHLHGSASLPQYDGYASDVTAPGEFKDYVYPNFQEARTLWYHDHGVHHTAQDVYAGLAAQYHLHDPRERAILPQGKFDVPLTITDVMLDENGNVAYDDHAHGYLMGDIILVNGTPWPTMTVQRRVYRFRVLVASVSRSFRPQLSDGSAMHVVATDSGLVPDTQPVTSWRHASGERYEVLIDFSRYPAGTTITLDNLSNPNNVDYAHTDKIMQFEVTGEPVDTSDPTWNRIPSRPNPDNAVMDLTAGNAVRRRSFAVERTNGFWEFGGHTWEDVVDSNYQFSLANPAGGDVEIWEIENRSAGWFHPVHIHLVDFRVLSRNRAAPLPHERGPKDVVYVGENERVELIMKFPQRNGRYMVHCSNLVHEDHDMMAQFLVGTDDRRLDPMLAAPARPQSSES